MMSYNGVNATFYLNKDLAMTEVNLGGTFVFLSSFSLYKSHDFIQLHLCSVGYFILVIRSTLGLEYHCKDIYTRRIYCNDNF